MIIIACYFNSIDLRLLKKLYQTDEFLNKSENYDKLGQLINKVMFLQSSKSKLGNSYKSEDFNMIMSDLTRYAFVL